MSRLSKWQRFGLFVFFGGWREMTSDILHEVDRANHNNPGSYRISQIWNRRTNEWVPVYKMTDKTASDILRSR